eukprot:1057276-Prorocentrum_minimum.AAC.1
MSFSCSEMEPTSNRPTKRTEVKGYGVDVRGSYVEVKGYGVDVRGSYVEVKGFTHHQLLSLTYPSRRDTSEPRSSPPQSDVQGASIAL